MARPLRIDNENGLDHVTNRLRGVLNAVRQDYNRPGTLLQVTW
jgi:hypothetical protein